MISRPASGQHLFLSCGEASGDRYGAALVAALRRERPDLRITALGGPALAMAGAELIASSDAISVMGFGEVLTHWRPLLRARRQVWRHLSRGAVDLAVPVDFPGFNLPLSAHARRCGVPVFYVVPPQLWAWGAWRIRRLRRDVDKLGTILPFEPDWFRQRGVDIVHLGHPLMEDYADYPLEARRRAREERLQDPTRPVVLGLLPGSRRQEIERLLPVMKVAAGMVQSWLGRRRVRLVVSRVAGPCGRLVGDLAGGSCEIADEPLARLLERLDLALVCSGTASLEVALAGVPHAIAYRTSGLNYALGRRLVSVPHIGLANLVLERSLVAEHIQDDADPAHLANSLLGLLNAPGRRHDYYRGCVDLRRRCGGAGVWRRAARAVLALLDKDRKA
ncbi:MAG TPA: lipid-A-disaccharide synthase [Candidatus Krumholzibacteria bacterium]|nr:lipid-A-disaccharide synthase [Candidatus Krumholzibacteria bacterium]HPD71694.1 lipid-A-disaccharide synthase [Candidatus Krumholzibacteria bacterium]HRY41373.1 lipid-A-disaccharide synthase [Candidatus Krumholzibacteria bacterium]